VQTETCNCKDDDCDGTTDEGSLCPSGATCTSCQCAFPCGTGEFPCPVGKMCNADKFCVNDPCFGVTCGPDGMGNKQECKNGQCVTSCSLLTCPTGTVCVGSTGMCEPDDCTTFPDRCSATQTCVAGQCVDNPCAGVTCQSDQYCSGGHCYSSCAGVVCDKGQECEMGMCVSDPCGAPCPSGQVCDPTTTKCTADPCQHVTCGQGQVCDPKTQGCVTDPCNGVTCPGTGQVCKDGSCYDPSQLQPDAGGPPTYVTTGGGGCAAGGGGGGLGFAMIILGLAAARRRRVA
jgi:MYXO-CTERM domain-containing protein